MKKYNSLQWRHSNEFSKGDILEANDRSAGKGEHYIIKLSDYTSSEFIGAMISTKLHGGANISMQGNHFEQRDENGKYWKIRYWNSHLVQGKFTKPEVWGPFAKVGQLTQEGFEFVESIVSELRLETFEEYCYRNNF